MEVKAGNDDAMAENVLRSALAMGRTEAATTAWFAIRFGRWEYGIFDVFADDAGREAHLAGPVTQALLDAGGSVFAGAPLIQEFDVLADKLPATSSGEAVTKALLLTFKAKAGHESQVAQFLRDAQALVEQEPKTVAWFAIRLDDGHFGIFDVFPDNGGRFAHLTGHVLRELAKHSLSLLGSVPDIGMLDVVDAKWADQSTEAR
ncbi:putative quinol monooxygenase [Paraburkholderia sediminicola]|uniref:putative quinol monooxygenase n=1 Tax=Paraburkholderia sediminicola TaxID=458836 RepID=UPI0038B869C1